jgi:tetratricopeptide (TPR) repeat protein
MSRRFWLSFLLFGFLASPGGTSIQGKIEGMVFDKNGKPLEKVTVTIVPQKRLGLLFELKTDNEGKFIQAGFLPGYYQVNFRKSGFMPQWKEARAGIPRETRLEIRLESGPKLGERRALEADLSLLKGNSFYGEKNFAKAAAAYEEAIQTGQGQWNTYLNLGLANRRLDKIEEAKTDFQKAVELYPQSYTANKELAEILASTDQYPESRKYYQRAAEISPEDPDASFHLGICLLNTLEQGAALLAFQKTIRLNAEYGEAYYHLGTLYIGQNRVKEAVESLEKFLKLAPGSENASTARQLLESLKKSRGSSS